MEKQFCLVCNSFDIRLVEPTQALDGRPEFKCDSCGHIFYYGKTGEPYYSYCINRKSK